MPQARRTITLVLAAFVFGWVCFPAMARNRHRRRQPRPPSAAAAPTGRTEVDAPTGRTEVDVSGDATEVESGQRASKRHPKRGKRAHDRGARKNRTEVDDDAATTRTEVEVGASKGGTPPRPSAAISRAMGHVGFVTRERAYLDRGTADGLGSHDVVILSRNGRPLKPCSIDRLWDHEATCVGGRPRAGDTFRIEAHATRLPSLPPPRPALPPLAAVIDDDTLAQRAAVIADVAVDKVAFSGRRHGRSGGGAEVSPGFTSWASQSDPQGGPYLEQRIDASIRGADIGHTGFRFDGAFSAVRWNQPEGVERFRPGTPTQFYLWEAAASRRQPDAATTVALGRLWPFHAPGLTLLDGAQIGRRNQARTVEVGLYGGFLPTVEGLAPSSDTRAAGAYAAFNQIGSKRTLFRLAREELRGGVWSAPGTGLVSQAEGLAQAWVGVVMAGGGGRLRWTSGDGTTRPSVETAYVDLGLQPSLSIRAGLHLRYLGESLFPEIPLRAETPLTGNQIHALADVQVTLSPRVAVAASAGADRQDDADLHQIRGGLELRLPRVFGDVGGLWLGGDLSRGWIQGEDIFLQLVGTFVGRVQVLARLSGNATRFETPAATWNLHEIGGALNVDGLLASWLRVRAWSLLRVPVLVQGEAAARRSIGSVAGLSLVGTM